MTSRGLVGRARADRRQRLGQAAARDHDAHVALGRRQRLDGPLDLARELGTRERQRDVQQRARVLEARQVLIERVRATAERAQRLEHAVAVLQVRDRAR